MSYRFIYSVGFTLDYNVIVYLINIIKAGERDILLMKDLAIYALLNGIAFTSELHNLDEVKLYEWIRNIDFENDRFFTDLRSQILTQIHREGPTRTSEDWAVPEWTLRKLAEAHENPDRPTPQPL